MISKGDLEFKGFVILVVFTILVRVDSAENNGSTSCVVVFDPDNTHDEFAGTCAPMTVPCTGLHPDHFNCSFYYQCDNYVIHRCPCGVGTLFDTEKNTCGNKFDSNCSCPNGPPPTSTSTVQTTTEITTIAIAEESNSGMAVGIVVGILIPLIIIIIVVVVIALVVRRRRQQALERKRSEMGSGIYSTIHDVPVSTSSTGVGDDLAKEEEGVYDNAAPPIPSMIGRELTNASNASTGSHGYMAPLDKIPPSENGMDSVAVGPD